MFWGRADPLTRQIRQAGGGQRLVLDGSGLAVGSWVFGGQSAAIPSAIPGHFSLGSDLSCPEWCLGAEDRGEWRSEGTIGRRDLGSMAGCFYCGE